MLEQEQKEEVLRRVGEEGKALFNTYRATLFKAVALRKLRGQERLKAYRERTGETWAMLQKMYPRGEASYEDQMKDWKQLESRDVREIRAGRTIQNHPMPPGIKPEIEGERIYPAAPRVGATSTPAIVQASGNSPYEPIGTV